jgi:hypothetical protein
MCSSGWIIWNKKWVFKYIIIRKWWIRKRFLKSIKLKWIKLDLALKQFKKNINLKNWFLKEILNYVIINWKLKNRNKQN